MKRRISQQTGASLVMIIAVIAVLMILATSMVALVSNAQSSRDRDRHRAQTFNVAEAAVDDALARLSASWPTTESTSLVWGTAQESAFKDAYASATNGLAAQYPTLRVKEWFYDNLDEPDPVVDGVIDSSDYTYDANGDGLMYVEVQAQDGKRSTRLRALVARRYHSSGLRRGMAWFSYDKLTANGGSEVFGVDASYYPPTLFPPLAFVGPRTVDRPQGANYKNDGDVGSSAVMDVYVGGIDESVEGKRQGNVHAPADVPLLEDVVYPEYITALKELAQSSTPTNYYTNPNDVSASPGFTPVNPSDPNSIAPLPPDAGLNDLSGLVYVDATQGNGTWTLQPKGQWNSPRYPGVLIIDGNLKITGNQSADYYGLLYVSGNIDSAGNMKMHGIVISASGGCALSGGQSVSYNDGVWDGLNLLATASVSLVPNTWRELKPLAVAY